MKIIFMTIAESTYGAICLKNVLDSNNKIITVLSTRNSGHIFKMIKKMIKKQGFVFFVFKLLKIFKIKAKLISRYLVGSIIKDREYLSVKEVLGDYKVKTIYSDNINNPEFIKRLKKIKPDLVVVAGFDQIIKKEFLNIPVKGVINIHASILPRYRGPEAHFWVLANKEDYTGATIHYVEEGIDTGNIILQEKIRILSSDNLSSLEKKTAKAGGEILLKVIEAIKNNNVKSIKQNEGEASYFSEPTKSDIKKLSSLKMLL